MRKFITMLVIMSIIISPTGMAENIGNSYETKSEAFICYGAGEELEIIDTITVEITEESITVYKSGVIDGYFYFPERVSNARYILLSDGTCFVMGHFKVVSDNILYVYFWINEVCELNFITGLTLIIIG